jgi:hypothetical protein
MKCKESDFDFSSLRLIEWKFPLIQSRDMLSHFWDVRSHRQPRQQLQPSGDIQPHTISNFEFRHPVVSIFECAVVLTNCLTLRMRRYLNSELKGQRNLNRQFRAVSAD